MHKFADNLTPSGRLAFVIILLSAIFIDAGLLVVSTYVKFTAETNYGVAPSTENVAEVLMLSSVGWLLFAVLVALSTLLFMWGSYWAERAEASTIHHERQMAWQLSREMEARTIWRQSLPKFLRS